MAYTQDLPELQTWLRWRSTVAAPPGLPLDVPGYARLAVYATQHARCAVCLSLWLPNRVCRSYPPAPWLLELDHDHGTGLIRGLLCGSCNCREGLPGYAEQPVFAAYRVRPPAQGAGWPYHPPGGWYVPMTTLLQEYERVAARMLATNG